MMRDNERTPDAKANAAEEEERKRGERLTDYLPSPKDSK
jgi:hypothetical protein